MKRYERSGNEMNDNFNNEPKYKRNLYTRYHSIKQRCYNPKSYNYKWYGGKGITVCDEWLNSYDAFEKWALANGYEKDLTIDRIDSSKDYCPENCRWITQSENTRKATFGKVLSEETKRKMSEHHSQKSAWNKGKRVLTKVTAMIEYNGECHTFPEWADITGIKYSTLKTRWFRGWTIEEILGGKTHGKKV